MFKSSKQERLFLSLRAELTAKAGYRGELVEERYRFSDWFSPSLPERVVPVALFGRTPTSYDNACFAILLANGNKGRDLVEGVRALGAPSAFEIDDETVTQWSVAAEPSAILPRRTFGLSEVSAVVAEHAAEWSPDSVLRAKNIAFELGPRQLDFIDLGLLPALESHIREKLDRLLRAALQAAQHALGVRTQGAKCAPQLFQLVFRFLAAKILHDRGVPGYSSLRFDEIDVVLDRVAKHYGDLSPVVDELDAKEALATHLWQGFSLQNLSVEVLAYIYENTLVDQLSRRELGTHSTPSAIARYIVHRLAFAEIPEDQRRVLEPCSGHGILLVAALQRLRELLPAEMDPKARHRYFARMLQGYEIDSFAIEVSKLCLVLADFPNHNGWQLFQEDVFESDRMLRELKRARIVLGNPPFEDFSKTARQRYKEVSSIHKPAEVLTRVLDHAHPAAMLGFVLPRQFIDGKGYRGIRERLAERFEKLEVIALPDGVFYKSDIETALLIAQQPVEAKPVAVSLSFGQVVEKDRELFLAQGVLSHRERASRSADELARSMALPRFKEIWDRLAGYPKLADVAEIHRGVEWQPPFDEERYISTRPKKGFERGIWKITNSFTGFIPPQTVYLSTVHEHRLWRAFEQPWHLPKVIANAARLSRRMWRLAAFADLEGLLCSQRFHAIWPNDLRYLDAIEGILNSPLANAFVLSFEGARDVKVTTLERLPIPHFAHGDVERLGPLVRALRRHLRTELSTLGRAVWESKAQELLFAVDAELMRLYDLPPRMERLLLDAFQGEQRRVPFSFTGYYNQDFTPQIPLWMLNSTVFQQCNGAFLRGTIPKITDPALIAALEDVE